MNELEIYKEALDLAAFVIITDSDGTITHVNQRYCDALGYKAEEIIGKNPRIFNSGFHPKSFFKEMLGTISQGKTWKGKIKNITQNGTYVWMDTIIFPFYPDGSLKLNYLAIRHDISNQIEDLKSREQFLSNVSHEIRTPLHGIINIIDILSKTSLNKQQSYYLNTIQSASESLLHLLNDVLDTFKIEFQKLILEKIEFNFIELINSVIALHEPKARDKNLKIKTEIDQNIPEFLEGDPTRIRQIISNLIDNAIKYTDEGEIKISINLLNLKKDNVRIKIKIKDTGIGIKENKKELIFQKYRQANDSDSRLYGGTGIGLHIVKELVCLMGGEIALESTIGKGSTFEIELNLAIPQKGNRNSPEIKETISFESMNLLIIDDSSINRIVLKKQMDTLGFDYSFAENGLQGLKLLASLKFDLILLDIQMPIMDGIEFLNELNDNIDYSEIKNIPIIIISAGNKEFLEKRFPQLNLKGYLQKPFKINDIRNKIGLSMNQPIALQPDQIANAVADFGTITNLNYLRELAAGDLEFMREIISTFISNTPAFVQSIKTNFRNNLFNEVAKSVHKFTPQMAFFGLDKYTSILKSIENNVENQKIREQIEEQINTLESILNKAIKELKELNV